MSAKTTILLLGSTGYVGGTVLYRLLNHPDAKTFEITTIVREEAKAKKLEPYGVKTVIGSFKSDLALLTQEVEKVHVVFNCGEADDSTFIDAVLAGMKNRHAKTGDVPILIHTSGTAIITVGHETKGMAATETIYDDSNLEQMTNLPAEALHRNVDLAVIKADTEGYVKSYLITPSTVFGVQKTPFVDAGIQNTHSIQIPWLIRAALGRGQAGMVGKGLSIWNAVHIEDTADLYIVLYDAITKNPNTVGHGKNGYYFAENGEYTWYDVSKAIGKAMVELHLSKSDEPTTFTTEELIKYWGFEWLGNLWGTNARGRASHSRSLGWKPKYTIADMLSSVKGEVEFYAKQK
ncbi:hypothetical protein EIP86_000953 [Pleurotus ostreatoroseus]|nr:hypothetical protein EIP86_000953 [Pleurotus ostreatoroseus]